MTGALAIPFYYHYQLPMVLTPGACLSNDEIIFFIVHYKILYWNCQNCILSYLKINSKRSIENLIDFDLVFKLNSFEIYFCGSSLVCISMQI